MIRHSVVSLAWAPEVILSLSAGPQRFNWLLQNIEGISDRVITMRLRELEAMRLVERHVDGGPPVRVHYQLTDRGHEYVAPLAQLLAVEQSQEVASQAS